MATRARVEISKTRVQERSKRTEVAKGDREDSGKRKKLGDIEHQAMGEQDPDKLAELFEDYHQRYAKEREAGDPGEKKRRTQDPNPSSGSGVENQSWEVRWARGMERCHCQQEQKGRRGNAGRRGGGCRDACLRRRDACLRRPLRRESLGRCERHRVAHRSSQQGVVGGDDPHEGEYLQGGEEVGGLRGDGQTSEQHEVGRYGQDPWLGGASGQIQVGGEGH